MAEVITIQHFSGHSGCEVRLMHDGQRYFVRKVTGDKSYSLRLIRQVAKQRRLAKLIRIPTIFDCFESNGLTGFDMEYITGHDPVTLCLDLPSQANGMIIAGLIGGIERLAQAAKGFCSSAVFALKIDSVADALLSNERLAGSKVALARAIDRLRGADWGHVPATMCHGDLTLENIIISDQETVFIDTLDSDLETVWMDLAKLSFDMDIGWSMRKILWADGHPDRVTLGVMLRHMREDLAAYVATAQPQYARRADQFELLQAVRILPYAHDALVRDRLLIHINTITNRGS